MSKPIEKVVEELTVSDSNVDWTMRSLRVLFLEDHPLDVELCIEALRRAGLLIQADVVDTMENFVAKLQSRVYDLILSDYGLPGWTGVDAFRLLKQSGMDIPFILLTGTLGEETAVGLIKEGIADYILKDRLARLPVAVHRALREKSTRDERERAIQALRITEERIRLLLDSTAEAIYGIDTRGRCTFSNAACLRLLGYDNPAELFGKNMHWLVHHSRPDGNPYPVEECAIFRAFRDCRGSHSESEVLWKKDGTAIPVEFWSYPMLQDGKPIGSVVTFLDITERKRTEQVLLRSKARIRHLVESSIIGIAIGDFEGKILDANDAFLSLVGYSREDLLSGDLRWDSMTPPDYHDSDLLALERLRTTGTAAPWEKQLIRKDGTRISVLIGVTASIDPKGQVEGVSFVLDITERKQLERQLRQAQKMEAVGCLAGGIAHDFNNLLGVIIGYSEMFEERMAPSDPLRPKAEQIKKAGQRAAQLTRQLLAFSRQEIIEPTLLDLNDVVADTLIMLQRMIGENIELTMIPGEELGTVKADRGQIEQVIMNLAVNARDAMPNGGKLIIVTGNAELDETYSRLHPPANPGSYVIVTVSDTGHGMDHETQAHIFDPFFTTKEKGKGTGLGLATVYGAVKQSGGYVWVYSEPGRGSTFKIYLPRVGGIATETESRKSLNGNARGSETVLLVEDSQLLRELAHELLENIGYTVLEAESGLDAIQIAAQYEQPIHLLLTDVVMPGMGGRELSERVMLSHPESKVLYMSGYTDSMIVHHGVLQSGVALLQKPFTRAALASKVREVLDAPICDGTGHSKFPSKDIT